MRKFLLFFCIILFVYSNAFNADWQLDDNPNILSNFNIHISELTFQQLAATFRAHPTVPDKIYRPVGCFSFGLNWYFGQSNVFGYHLVNIFIHILTAWFLFLTMRLLLRIHYQKQHPPQSQFFTAAAVLGALLWALAPIQTQAVTYIVQRMAAMAAMFSIIAIYAYLRGKTAAQEKKYLWFALCLVSFCAALGSKENAVLLPASLLLVELSFFRHHVSKKHFSFFLLISVAAFTAGFFFIRYGLEISSFHFSNFFSFLEGYDERSFTFKERLLTEPRIVLVYLSQIFLPNVQRLSIDHDIIPSTSLFFPWNTFPSILIIILITSISLVFLKKYPLFCFPVFFFFLNHTVESTVAPLELMFEHRNYLPSLFLFLPVGIFVAHILYSTPPQPVFRRITAMLCTILFLIISGHATYTRNQTWTTVESLWADALRKAPNSSRAAFFLGKEYLQAGQYTLAYRYFQLSLMNANRAANPKFTKKVAFGHLGAIQYFRGQYESALQHFNQCLELDRKDESCLKNRLLNFLKLDFPEKALSDALQLVRNYPDSEAYYYLTALSFYKIGNNEEALKWLQKITKESLNSYEGAYLTGILLMKAGAYKNSLLFLQQAAILSSNSIKSHLALAAARYASGQISLSEDIMKNAIKKYPLLAIKKSLEDIRKQDEINKDILGEVENILLLSIRYRKVLFIHANE